MSRKTKPQRGYLMTEETHSQVMRGLDSLRFLEGLLCTAISTPVPPCFDMDDLAGYLQLLLEQTHKPLKALEYQCWAPAEDERCEHDEDKGSPAEGEAELLRDYRAMLDGDRKHLRRCAEGLAYAASQGGHCEH